ncbi:MAG: hypothetical protein JOS17DRAFT_495304 [Linnemannia elongata]|nr:MAG: hypothetical protein JOS17DRAFT_495304 [Linnemannia elongata]
MAEIAPSTFSTQPSGLAQEFEVSEANVKQVECYRTSRDLVHQHVAAFLEYSSKRAISLKTLYMGMAQVTRSSNMRWVDCSKQQAAGKPQIMSHMASEGRCLSMISAIDWDTFFLGRVFIVMLAFLISYSHPWNSNCVRIGRWRFWKLARRLSSWRCGRCRSRVWST